MADHHRDRAMSQRVDQRHHVAHAIERRERRQVLIERDVGAAAAAVAALVGGDDVVARLRQRQHHVAPAIAELREPVDQQHGRTVRRFRNPLRARAW